ncbi:MAG: DUF4190 domain-containing protein [Chloroflexi bacterium]|nr:MAG: DUF4190 domain-containing protein [Chloroflexota bacterium]
MSQTPPPSRSQTQIAGQESAPVTTVPQTPGLAGYTSSTGRYNTMAVVSLVSGLLSVFGHIAIPGLGGGVLAIVAIATGFIGRGEIKRTGEQGMWMSTLGIVLGIIHIALIGVIVALLLGLVGVIATLALSQR